VNKEVLGAYSILFDGFQSDDADTSQTEKEYSLSRFIGQEGAERCPVYS
jgi:hypothetical protein